MSPKQTEIYVRLKHISDTKRVRSKKKDIENSLWLINTLRETINNLENKLQLANKRTEDYCNLFSKLDHVKNLDVSTHDLYYKGIEGFHFTDISRALIKREEIITIQLLKI
jgi:predicted RNase H-like nuclease (RuvC/YqgF family)